MHRFLFVFSILLLGAALGIAGIVLTADDTTVQARPVACDKALDLADKVTSQTESLVDLNNEFYHAFAANSPYDMQEATRQIEALTSSIRESRAQFEEARDTCKEVTP